MSKYLPEKMMVVRWIAGSLPFSLIPGTRGSLFKVGGELVHALYCPDESPARDEHWFSITGPTLQADRWLLILGAFLVWALIPRVEVEAIITDPDCYRDWRFNPVIKVRSGNIIYARGAKRLSIAAYIRKVMGS